MGSLTLILAGLIAGLVAHASAGTQFDPVRSPDLLGPPAYDDGAPATGTRDGVLLAEPLPFMWMPVAADNSNW